MSTGGIIGGVVGGIGGFIYGGPVGAVYGFGIGMGIGSFIDPVSSSSNIGAPKTQELTVTTAQEGDVIPDLLGLSKLAGNIIMYWGDRSVEVKEEQEGGKGGGGSSDVIVGHKYYLSWLQCLCIGPVDYLYTIYMNDDVVWVGELARPESGGEVTITLVNYSNSEGTGETIGNLTFYFGTDDHALNTKFENGLADPALNTPYRRRCYAFFDDCLLGSYNRVPVFKFVIAKRPVFSFSALNTINKYDYNAAHAIYYWLTNSVDLPTSFIDETSFAEVASTSASESFGISVLLDKSVPANTYIDNLLFHINGIKFYAVDKKLHIKLLRPDVDVADMPTISESDLISEPSIKRGSWAETTNYIKGIFPLRIGGEFQAADIFGLFKNGSLIWGVRFDGVNLVELGYYESPSGDINGLVFKGDDLLTVGGIGSTASMRTINSETFALSDEVDPFNDYDAVVTNQGTLAIDEITGKVYYTEGSDNSTGARQIALSSELVRESRGFLGSVVIGTDARYYLYDYVYESLGWESAWKPITGASWPSFWNLIEDDIFDDAVPIIWGGVDPLRTSDALFPRNLVYNNYLYSCMNSSPSGKLRKYNLTDLLMAETVTTGLIYQITAYDGFIYSVEGVTGMTVKKYNADTLAYIDEVILSPGRPGDITSTPSYIIVLCSIYTGDGSIHKLSPDLEILASANLGTTLWQMVDGIDDTFVALGGNSGVGIFNIATMEMVDEISAPIPPTGSYYDTQELITRKL